ncbi:MAG: protein-glutamate O-methyltransferase CheR [Planctomycetes bacterium]|nr:protein-glutamate O-methyltransferase CheR [Planctomycetota bacterium]
MLTPDEFARFASLVYDRAGIHLPPSKSGLLSNRLRQRLRALKIASFGEYYKRFTNAAFVEEELPYFLSAVTTNETYFFRNAQLWNTLGEKILPGILERNGRTARTLKVWSAASSSGEEAYTVGILLLERIPDAARWTISVVGSDISQKVLDRARTGLYNDYAVSRTTPARVSRWFDKVDGQYRVKDEVRKLVRFQFHNLRERFPSGGFDFVLLRNVLMYFDAEMKRKTIANVCEAVAPGGWLYVGDVDPIRTSSELVGCMPLQPSFPGFYQRALSTSAADSRKELVRG